MRERKKITINESFKINPNLNPDLFLPTPRDIYRAIHRPPISQWLKFIMNAFKIPSTEILVITPCSAYKPYSPPRDELYRRIHVIKRLYNRGNKKRRLMYFITVSVPLAVEPEDFWTFKWQNYNLIYDAPFFPWIEEYGVKWDTKLVEKILNILRDVFKKFIERNRIRFKKSVAFLTPSWPERKIVEELVDLIVPEEDPPVSPSYDNNASEIYCHPLAWNTFINTLNDII